MEREKTISDLALQEIVKELRQEGALNPLGMNSPATAEIPHITDDTLTQICSYVAARVLADSFLPKDYVRVFRIVEHYGPRADVQQQLQGSLTGTRRGTGKSFITAYPLEHTDLYNRNKF